MYDRLPPLPGPSTPPAPPAAPLAGWRRRPRTGGLGRVQRRLEHRGGDGKPPERQVRAPRVHKAAEARPAPPIRRLNHRVVHEPVNHGLEGGGGHRPRDWPVRVCVEPKHTVAAPGRERREPGHGGIGPGRLGSAGGPRPAATRAETNDIFYFKYFLRLEICINPDYTDKRNHAGDVL